MWKCFGRFGCIHQSHTDKWNLFCPLLLIIDNKNKKTLVVVIQDVSSCRNVQFWAGRNCRMCSMWLNVGNCTETNCTWRFKADSFCNKHHLGCSANDSALLTTSHWALICVRASVKPPEPPPGCERCRTLTAAWGLAVGADLIGRVNTSNAELAKRCGRSAPDWTVVLKR